jgi:hypothetical protein
VCLSLMISNIMAATLDVSHCVLASVDELWNLGIYCTALKVGFYVACAQLKYSFIFTDREVHAAAEHRCRSPDEGSVRSS